MRSGRIHRIAAAIAAALVLSLSATPAWSSSDQHENLAADATSPPMFDLFVLRPIALVGVGISGALFLVPVAPITLLTRPTDIGKPFNKLVVAPVRYVVADPLGDH